MRLLLDQNLPYSTTKALAADCDVVHTEDVALQQVTDPEIFSYCVATERVLVTPTRNSPSSSRRRGRMPRAS